MDVSSAPRPQSRYPINLHRRPVRIKFEQRRRAACIVKSAAMEAFPLKTLIAGDKTIYRSGITGELDHPGIINKTRTSGEKEAIPNDRKETRV